MLPVGAGGTNRLGGQTHDKTMKKLFSLNMVALIALVIVGCEKKDEAGTAAGAGAAATNAVTK